jgi:lipopolysaccharide/colanic/teichoic acid biosynthesis glycosyltransferase
LIEEQHLGESYTTDSRGATALTWEKSGRRGAPVLPESIGFSAGEAEAKSTSHISPERVTELIVTHVASASQASALPRFLRDNLTNDKRNISPIYLSAKRITDIVVSLAFMILLIIGLCVALEDRGPILYYQTRVGKNGRHFRFYKFRSMVVNADALKDKLAKQNESTGPAFKMRNDPRVTRIGRFLRKTSLDELPQFINVLRGEMTLVGPRPHLPREVNEYEDWHFERQNAEPGLLCLREVLGRSNLTFDQWVAYDLLYIRNRSVKTDLWILFRLIPALLKADGAY